MQTQDIPNKTEEYLSFTPGQTIFLEGARGDDMYIVVEGQVNIVTDSQIVETVEPGGIFGEMALIDNRPRSAAAIARTNCLLTPIGREHFLTLIKSTPLFAIQVMRVMADRLRRATPTSRELHD